MTNKYIIYVKLFLEYYIHWILLLVCEHTLWCHRPFYTTYFGNSCDVTATFMFRVGKERRHKQESYQTNPFSPPKNWADSRFMAPQNRKLFILTWEMGNKMKKCACLNPATDNSTIKRIDDFTGVFRCAELMESRKWRRVCVRIVRLVHLNVFSRILHTRCIT